MPKPPPNLQVCRRSVTDLEPESLNCDRFRTTRGRSALEVIGPRAYIFTCRLGVGSPTKAGGLAWWAEWAVAPRRHLVRTRYPRYLRWSSSPCCLVGAIPPGDALLDPRRSSRWEVLMTTKSLGFRAVIAVCTLIVTGLVAVGAESPAEAASKWGPGTSRDRLEGDARREARPPTRRTAPPRRSTRRRCTSARCRRAAPPPSESASQAEKELVLPKPTILIDPDFSGMVGATSFVRVQSPALFSDYVGTADTGASVEARPTRVECSAGEQILGAPLSDLSTPGRASTPPIPLEPRYAGTLVVSCRLFWDAEWRSNDGAGGAIPDRESWNERAYPVGGIVAVLVR